ncbi:MAG: cyclic nucleotide-binding domain-containing protein [Magnetococcales bacterium]|nr:cyclic nucleotide-binding domain-containing protein [Magnetococcales bacterium]
MQADSLHGDQDACQSNPANQRHAMQAIDRNTRTGLSIINLMESGFFAHFTDEKKAAVSRHKMFVMFKDGEYLLKKGEDGDCFFIIMKGSVSITDERNKVLNTLTTGSVVGEVSFLTGQPRTSNIIANGDAIAMKLDHENMDQLEEYIQIEIKNKLIQVLVDRIRRHELLIISSSS